MSERHQVDRANSFAADPLAWTTLHHFLTAGLLKELCSSTVRVFGEGVAFEDLFDDVVDGLDHRQNWSIVPRKVEGKSSHALQDHIRALVWANDAQVGPFAPRGDIEPWIIALRDARRLGRIDLGAPVRELDSLAFPEQDGANLIRDAVRLALPLRDERLETVPKDIASALKPLSRPLAVLALKQLGDLFGDADNWDSAATFYQASDSAIQEDLDPCWHLLELPLRDIISQSLAQAEWMVAGPAEAARRLDALIDVEEPARRLGVLNASHEALVARLDSDDRDWDGDRRAATLTAPLILGSQDVSAAVRALDAGKHEDSYRRFWAVLRRQIALGSHAESASTKAQYARALLSEGQDPARRHRPEAFRLGAWLMVESGLKDAADTLVFTNAAVSAYVTPDLVAELVARSKRHAGARHGRHRVLVQLLSAWGQRLSRDASPSRMAVLNSLVDITQAFGAEFDARRNVGGEGLKALVALSVRRPDLRAQVAGRVTDLVVQKLEQKGWWTGTAEALNLARNYLDVFDGDQLHAVAVATLTALQREDPQGMTPIITPALEILLSEDALRSVQGDADVTGEYFTTLLRYAASARTSSMTLMFALSRLAAPTLARDNQAYLSKIVADLSQAVTEHNSSSATDAIRALVSAAALVGPGPLRIATSNLATILKSARAGRPATSFAYAFGPVLDLAEIAPTLASDRLQYPAGIDDMMLEIEQALVIAWSSIAERPELLAPFTIPPANRPNETIAHNWTVATQRFAEQRPNDDVLKSAVQNAARIPVLARAVSTTFAAAQSLTALEPRELAEIAKEPTEVFYGGIGRRLLVAEALPHDEKHRLLGILMRRCLEVGPRPDDLALLLAALPYARDFDPPIDFTAYERAVQAENLSLTLAPVIFAWKERTSISS